MSHSVSMTSADSVTTTFNLSNAPQTHLTPKINVANTFDAQSRLKKTERELSTAHARLTREIRKNRQLQQQIYDYMLALTRATHDQSVVRHHFELLSSSHLALSQECQKARVMVETLEAVIQMLYVSSPKPSDNTDSSSHDGHSVVEK